MEVKKLNEISFFVVLISKLGRCLSHLPKFFSACKEGHYQFEITKETASFSACCLF